MSAVETRTVMFLAAGLVLVFLLAVALTRWLVSPPAFLQVLDHPNQRSLHQISKPRTGGLAVLASTLTGTIALVSLAPALPGSEALQEVTERLSSGAVLILASALALVAVISFLDDRYGVPPAGRLALQMLAAVVLLTAGLTLQTIPIPMFGVWHLGSLALPITVLFVVWMANLYNFMDGIDGFAGGMAVCGFGCLGALALWRGGVDLAWLSLALSSAAAGFLVFNFPPARIFLGDVGSVPIGLAAAALGLEGIRQGIFDIWVPIILFSPFIVDATVVVVWRLLSGKRLWEAHRQHAYQRLVLAGWSHRRTVLVEYALMLCSGLAAFLYLAHERWRVAILGGGIIVYGVLLFSVRRVEAARLN